MVKLFFFKKVGNHEPVYFLESKECYLHVVQWGLFVVRSPRRALDLTVDGRIALEAD